MSYGTVSLIMQTSPVQMDTRAKLDMKAGDTVKVYQKIQEKGKTRLQVFEGMVLARKHGTEAGATFTVRRNTGGYGVEKIFPLYSPMIDKIEITKRSKIRRSKLYFVRRKALKQVSKRLKMMFVDIKTEDEVEAPVVEEETTTATDTSNDVAEATEANEEAPVESEQVAEEAPAETTPEVVEEKTEEAK